MKYASEAIESIAVCRKAHMHGVSLITTVAAAFGLALIFDFIAAQLKLPVLLGYLIAGVMYALQGAQMRSAYECYF